MSEEPNDIWPPPPTLLPPKTPKLRQEAIRFFWPSLPMMATFGIPIHSLVLGLRLPPGAEHNFLVSASIHQIFLLGVVVSIFGIIYWCGWKKKARHDREL